uniref:Uncharacterized protein n=1 Tax=Chenopodium quinoa TaxID=63459 RepID=A0A803KQV0_CHEQI
MRASSAKEAWSLLKEEFHGNEKIRNIRLNTLRSQYDNMKMKENEDIKDLNESLLSVAQMDNNGYSLVFENNHCTIIDSNKKEIVKVPMENKSFLLKWDYPVENVNAANSSNTWLWHRSRDVEFDEDASWNWEEEKVEKNFFQVDNGVHNEPRDENIEEAPSTPIQAGNGTGETSDDDNATGPRVNEKLSRDDGQRKADTRQYRSLVGSLLYLRATRPNLMFAASLLSRFMSEPRVLSYIRGTSDFGVMFNASANSKLLAYSDSDWGGSNDDMK